MEDKGTAAELYKTKIPLKTAREQVQMNERSLIRVLALAKINTESPPSPLPWRPGWVAHSTRVPGRPGHFHAKKSTGIIRRGKITATGI
jgi:hypothetical protein